MKTIPLILIQHAEDASHLWNVRSSAVGAADYTLCDLRNLDGRLEANLDGLRIAGEDGWNVLKDEVGWRTPGDLFCATVLALGWDNPRSQRLIEVFDAVMELPELRPGLVSGLGWLAFPKIAATVETLLSHSSPVLRQAGIEAMTFHGRDPGPHLQRALTNSNSELRAAVMRAGGELGRTDLLPLFAEDLAASDVKVRFSAAWAHALLSPAAAPLSALQAIALSAQSCREQALEVALARMEAAAARQWVSALMKNPATDRLACLGIGMLGDPELLPWAIEHMNRPKVARVAGGAFTRLTGIDLALHDLEGVAPQGREDAEPNDDPKNEAIAMEPDGDLPWPDAQKIEKWWCEHRTEYPSGTAYLCGLPISNGLGQVIATGRQRYRTSAALRMSMRAPGRLLFNVAAPVERQRAALKLAQSV